ncbi:J domain-containing protein, partial [archaeon]
TPAEVEVDHYAALGVPTSASDAAIRAAYKKLVMKLHPDRRRVDSESEEEASAATQRFISVQQAYDILSDDAKRKEYDHMRRVGASGFHQQAFSSRRRPTRMRVRRWQRVRGADGREHTILVEEDVEVGGDEYQQYEYNVELVINASTIFGWLLQIASSPLTLILLLIICMRMASKQPAARTPAPAPTAAQQAPVRAFATTDAELQAVSQKVRKLAPHVKTVYPGWWVAPATSSKRAQPTLCILLCLGHTPEQGNAPSSLEAASPGAGAASHELRADVREVLKAVGALTPDDATSAPALCTAWAAVDVTGPEARLPYLNPVPCFPKPVAEYNNSWVHRAAELCGGALTGQVATPARPGVLALLSLVCVHLSAGDVVQHAAVLRPNTLVGEVGSIVRDRLEEARHADWRHWDVIDTTHARAVLAPLLQTY